MLIRLVRTRNANVARAASTTFTRWGAKNSAKKGNLQKFASDFNPFAMRVELSFNLPKSARPLESN